MGSGGWLEKGTNAVATANGVVAAVLFGALTLVVALQVFTRFILHTPFIWSEEVARFLFFWVVLLGSAMSVRTRRHFVIDITMGRKGGGGSGSRFLAALPDLCVLAFSVFLLVEGIGYTQTGLFRTGPNSHVNMGAVYVALPVFAALSILYSVQNLLLDWRSAGRGEDTRPRPPGGAE
jgi:TRAP-type C4-dicarboxylate transport system permease small subunit